MIKDSNATPPALLPVAVARMTGIGEPPGAFKSLSISGRVKRQPRMKTKPERIATGIPITIALGIYQVVRIESTSSFESLPLTCLVGTATSSDMEEMKPIPHMTKQPGSKPMQKVKPLPQLIIVSIISTIPSGHL